MSQRDSLLEIYIYENLQLLSQMEALLLAAEKKGEFSKEDIDAIFRTLHTVKGSSAMMEFEGLKKVSHAMEDLLGFLREGGAYDHKTVFDLVFEAGDFLKSEIGKLQEGHMPQTEPRGLLKRITSYFSELKKSSTEPETPAAPEAIHEAREQDTGAGGARFYRAHITFQPDSKMENVRAFGVVKSVEKLCRRIKTLPAELFAEHSQELIASEGFTLFMESDRDGEALRQAIDKNLLLETVDFTELEDITGTPAGQARQGDKRRSRGGLEASAYERKAGQAGQAA